MNLGESKCCNEKDRGKNVGLNSILIEDFEHVSPIESGIVFIKQLFPTMYTQRTKIELVFSLPAPTFFTCFLLTHSSLLPLTRGFHFIRYEFKDKLRLGQVSVSMAYRTLVVTHIESVIRK